MGFLKRNWERISADTVSGVLGRLIASILLGLGCVYAGSKNRFIAHRQRYHCRHFVHYRWHIISVDYYVCSALPMILEWLSWMRESKTQGSWN